MSFKKIVTDTFIQFLFLKISPMTDILVLDFSLAFIKYLFPATTRTRDNNKNGREERKLK